MKRKVVAQKSCTFLFKMIDDMFLGCPYQGKILTSVNSVAFLGTNNVTDSTSFLLISGRLEIDG